MENIIRLMSQAFHCFLFCIAVGVLYMEYHSYQQALGEVSQIIQSDVIYEQGKDKSDQNTVKKAEVMSALFQSPEYDIEIDEVLISKSENVKLYLSSITSWHEEYSKSYIYDQDGVVTRVIYHGL